MFEAFSDIAAILLSLLPMAVLGGIGISLLECRLRGNPRTILMLVVFLLASALTWYGGLHWMKAAGTLTAQEAQDQDRADWERSSPDAATFWKEIRSRVEAGTCSICGEVAVSVLELHVFQRGQESVSSLQYCCEHHQSWGAMLEDAQSVKNWTDDPKRRDRLASYFRSNYAGQVRRDDLPKGSEDLVITIFSAQPWDPHFERWSVLSSGTRHSHRARALFASGPALVLIALFFGFLKQVVRDRRSGRYGPKG